MKYLQNITLAMAAILALNSCEKVIDLDLEKSQNQLVIQGVITDQAGPYIVNITKSINIKQDGQATPIASAKVSISDDAGQTEQLTDMGDGNYKTTTLKGIPGRTYTLSVDYDGKNYKASSKMPKPVPFESILYRELASADGSSYTVTPKFTDPAELGNNYRFILKINDKSPKTERYNIDNDDINNGKPYDRPLFDNEIKQGDQIEIEMRCTDRAAYNYYYTLQQVRGNGPGGGTTPSNPPNNIPGALGLFTAYSTQTKKITIPL